MSLSFWIRDYVFLPSAMIRREMWWRNLMLVVSMVAFGLWHKATVLFVIWGAYHGVVLLLHRQVQQAQRRFDWNPPEHLWTPLSWAVTISVISMGWIFFRANSLPQMLEMLSAVASPSSYLSQYLGGSLYALVVALAAAYAAALLASGTLDRYANGEQTAEAQSGFLAWMARNRWYWAPPLYVLTLFFLLMVTLTQSGGAAQLMYRGF
jgi:D-alanyl-lipoteichoic acid acyltransferase DltB (MBOAT superfamily)